MATVIDNEYMVCVDCLSAIVNDDYTGLDYSLDEDAAAEREQEIRAAIAAVGGHLALGDSEKDEEFSSGACDCCGTRLAGARHHCVVMD